MSRPVKTMALGRAAAKLMFTADLVRLGGIALAVAGPLAGASIAAYRLLPGVRVVALPLLIGVPLVVAVAGAIAVSVARRPGLLKALRDADRRLGLSDRLSSAYELAESKAPFASLAVDDAESKGDASLLRRAFPIQFGNSWVVAGVSALAVAALAMWLPLREASHPPAIPKPTAEQVAQASTQIRAATDAIKQLVEPRAQATASELENLAEIERDLATGNLTPEEARAKSAEEIEKSAAAAEDAARTTDNAADLSAQELASAAKRSGAGGGPSSRAGEIAKSLSQGDARSAAEAAQRISETAKSLPAAEREAMANELWKIAKELDEKKLEDAKAAERKTAETTPVAKGAGAEPTERSGETESPGPTGTQKRVSEKTPEPDSSKPGDSKPTAAKQASEREDPNPAGKDSEGQAPKEASDAKRDQKNSDPPKNSESKSEKGQSGTEKQDSPQSEDGEKQTSNDGATKRPDSEPPAEKKSRQKLDKLTQALRDAAKELTKPGTPDESQRGEQRQSPGEKKLSTEKPNQPQDRDKPETSENSSKPTSAKSEDLSKQPTADEKSPPASDPARSGEQRPSTTDQKDPGRNAREGAPQPRQGEKRPAQPAGAPKNQKEDSKTGASQKSSQPGENQQGEKEAARGDPKSNQGSEQKDKDPAPGANEQSPAAEKQDPVKSADQSEKQSDSKAPSPNDRKTPGQSGGALERLAKELNDLANQRSNAAQDRERARELRRQAQRLLDKGAHPELPKDLPENLPDLANQDHPDQASPDGERPQDIPDATPRKAPGADNSRGQGNPDEKSGAQGKPQGDQTPGTNGAGNGAKKNDASARPDWNGKTEVVDARAKPGEHEQTNPSANDPNLSVSPGPESRQSLRSTSSAVLNDRVRRAATGAERAVEQQAVPPQYSPFVKRVFRRYIDRVGAGESSSAPVAPTRPATPDAPDSTRAVPKK